jgi:hypothetical protein
MRVPDYPYSAEYETGDTVPRDQTAAIRIKEGHKKAKNLNRSVCQGGCGKYLTEEEKSTHECPGPRGRHRANLAKWLKRNEKTKRRAEMLGSFLSQSAKKP